MSAITGWTAATEGVDGSTPGLIHDWLDAAAERTPDSSALIWADGAISYGALANETRRVAGSFRKRGVKRGDRIVLLLANCREAVTCIFAASRIGAAFVVLHPKIQPFHLRHIVDVLSPTLMVVSTSSAPASSACIWEQTFVIEEDWQRMLQSEPIDSDGSIISSDTATIIFTSGSSGYPRGVVSSHRNIRFVSSAIQQRLVLRKSDVIALFLPLAFDYGLYQIFLAFQVGAAVALGSEAGANLLVDLKRFNATVFPAVPPLATGLVQLLKRERSLPVSIRMVTNTGSRLSEAIILDLQRHMPGVAVYPMYGLTECKRVSILMPHELSRKMGSVGRALPDTECLVVDEEGRELPANSDGELVVRGPHVMSGYWSDVEATRSRFRRWGPHSEIVLFTGDRCFMDDEGYLYFIGRGDDIFKQQGYRVSGSEIEAAALDWPSVSGASLLRHNDKSFLFVEGDVDALSVISELRKRLEPYKIPQHVLTLAELPRNERGKVDKQQLFALVKTAENDVTRSDRE